MMECLNFSVCLKAYEIALKTKNEKREVASCVNLKSEGRIEMYVID